MRARAAIVRGLSRARAGNKSDMLTILLIVLLALLLAGVIGGPRYYSGRRTTVVRERDMV